MERKPDNLAFETDEGYMLRTDVGAYYDWFPKGPSIYCNHKWYLLEKGHTDGKVTD